jgi:3-deoxy-7-phosphoheptulonate synthase
MISTEKTAEAASNTTEWSPSSWRQKKAKQQPVYADPVKHQKALDKLETLPPLVTAPEVVPTNRNLTADPSTT